MRALRALLVAIGGDGVQQVRPARVPRERVALSRPERRLKDPVLPVRLFDTKAIHSFDAQIVVGARYHPAAMHDLVSV
jgi:hypothetical protein